MLRIGFRDRAYSVAEAGGFASNSANALEEMCADVPSLDIVAEQGHRDVVDSIS